MKFCLSTILILTTIKDSVQSCVSIDVIAASNFGYRFYKRPLYDVKKYYIQCQNIIISSDFHTKVDPLVKDVEIQWLEINNTNSPEIASGAFSTLQTIPDLRINGASVFMIQVGAFDGLSNLTQLSLKNNKINNLCDNCFNSLTNLTMLDLSFNNLANINEQSFAGLKRLRQLILQHNFISNLTPTLFRNLTMIEILDLSFNKLVNIDENLLINLSRLTSLWLNNNNLHVFSTNLLSKNLQLQSLNINNNYISTLNNVSFPNVITIMNASCNLIQSLSYLKFTEMKIIDLSANGITKLKINSFKNFAVTELYLDRNYLGLNEFRSETFSNLSTLEIISLSNNQIKQLNPDFFKNNNRLRKLNLANNYLGHTDILNLPVSLEELHLDSNNFGSQLNISTLINLQLLDISFNNLTEISFHFLSGLKKLSKLYLQNNKISKINVGCFRDLQMLKNLDLSNNNISVLEIGVFVGLDGLNSLDVSHNKLNALNEGVFHNLKNLRSLSFSYNNISYFSFENTLSHLVGLREIGLGGNDWSCVLLTDILKMYRRIKLKDGNNFNITNVDGIPCNYRAKESLSMNNLQAEYFSTTTSKLNTNNNLLILILVLLTIKLVLKYMSNFLKKGTLARQKSEQELQLI